MQVKNCKTEIKKNKTKKPTQAFTRRRQTTLQIYNATHVVSRDHVPATQRRRLSIELELVPYDRVSESSPVFYKPMAVVIFM